MSTSMELSLQDQVSVQTTLLCCVTATLLGALLSYLLRSPKAKKTKSPPVSSLSMNPYSVNDSEEEELSELDLKVRHDSDQPHVPYKLERYSIEEMADRSKAFYKAMDKRRSLRFFSKETFPIEVLENCILTAGTAPSGAHCQPWTYCVVQKPENKAEIREIIEKEEKVNYDRRMSASWKKSLEFCATDDVKPYLEEAPYVVVVFKQKYGFEDGTRVAHYYPEQSVGISVGLFISALTNAGLVTLTSTPMGAEAPIRKLLQREQNENVFLVMPVGFPASDGTVPNIARKPLKEIMASDP